MIDHMSLAVHDLVASAEAYERMLAPLGLGRLVERSGAVSFGKLSRVVAQPPPGPDCYAPGHWRSRVPALA